MPHYAIHHSCHIAQSQYQAFASALTTLHCTLFSAPSAFVNITFHEHNTTTQYISVGGKQVWTNYIHAHLRPRGADNRHKLDKLVTEIMRIWDEEIRGQAEEARPSGSLDDARGLHNVFVMEDIVAGAEQGFLLPVAGQDGKWMEENLKAFEKRARDGEESMQALVEEVKGGLGKKSEG